jgi:transposase-like protein
MFSEIQLVRIPKRLVRYNLRTEYYRITNQYSNLENKSVHAEKSVYNRKQQYACEKCGKVFNAWKNLHLHKVENHSY